MKEKKKEKQKNSGKRRDHDLMSSEYYFDRELSWLEFNERVLDEAWDKTNPLLERLKFLSITASNLDEFFMVRVSALMEQEVEPVEQLRSISKRTHEMVAKQYSCLNRSILPALAKENIFILGFDELDVAQRDFADRYYESTVYPIVTPMAVDPSRRFPLLNNKSTNIIIEIEEEDDNCFAVVQIPTVIPRILKLPSTPDKKQFIFLEDIILEHISELFIGHKVLHTALFRITRNSDLNFDEEDADDLMTEMVESIKRRKWGEPVRLEIEKNMVGSSRKFLQLSLSIDESEIYEIGGIFDLTIWMSFIGRVNAEHLMNKPLIPQPSVDFMQSEDLFEVIRNKDVLVHHPYESFDCVLNFVRTAANDPHVLAIKQTLYRVSGDSPVVSALMQAAENGKQVTVLVELKARFDEENNIKWAKTLEQAGCHVVYGLIGLKTHCKICLVVRKEDDGIRRYIHLGTGNYNDSTAKIYTDMGFFTCKETFGQDVSSLFNVLTGYSTYMKWNKLAVAPVTLRQMFLKYIADETKHAQDGKDACIIAKLNSLVDGDIIRALYKASMAGVKIKLLVRGICCLRTGIEGVSENITVMSIVDRYLEHSRIFYFENSGEPKIFLSSADWMPRNLDRRVEVAFPIEEPDLKEKIIEILNISLSDTIKLRIQQHDGTYEKVDRRGKDHIHSQLIFHQMAVENCQNALEQQKILEFKPVYNKD